MMDLISKLTGLGGQPQAPTDMSQIKVPQQAMDLAGTIPVANSQLSYAKAAEDASGVDWKRVGLGALGAGAGLLARGGGGSTGQTYQVNQYHGGREPDPMNAEKFSGANMAGQQKWAQVPGLMSRG